MIGILVIALLNLAFGAWVLRLIAKDPANLRKRRNQPPPESNTDNPEPPNS